jgi:ribokinase
MLVSGLINIETTLKIESFPLHYNAVNYPFNGINTTVSGVGYNISKALTTLGDGVVMLSMIGNDQLGDMVLNTFKMDGIDTTYILRHIESTPQSIIIYDNTGQRQIHVDLKTIQETPYPLAAFERAMDAVDAVVLCNINYSRPMLHLAKQAGKLIATDVHEITELNDPYNQDFMQMADILFMSGTSLHISPIEWITALQNRFNPEVIVVSMGADGAWLAAHDTKEIFHLPAVKTRPIVNTIGAGDALFSAFLHFYLEHRHAIAALENAMVFASYKIGDRSAASGFLTDAALLKLKSQLGSGA